MVESDKLEIQPGYLGPTLPVGQLPPKGERQWIEHPEQLQQAIEMLKNAPVVAIDAEFMQVRSRSFDGGSSIPRLSLLQIAIDNHCFVIDTLRLKNLSPLNAIVSDPAVAVLLHGAGADLRVMAERGIFVAHYYDLEATSRSIFGQHESSLAAMLWRAFNMRLDKSLQRTDWTRRPLPPAMVAYAARDAEVTLALYYWLEQHFHAILQRHENDGQYEEVAPWIEPFLRGTAHTSPEVAVAEARADGRIRNKAQIYADCRHALKSLRHPMRLNRLLRLLSDLSLTKLAPDILPLLQAPTSDERAGSVRTLGRLGIKSALEPIQALLQDPVHDVRKAAQNALRNLDESEPREQRAVPTRTVDGARSWIVGISDGKSDSEATSDDSDWKARLRSAMES
ncbi:HEAT repeat domain-containing protein [Ktedonospora formicarum]|uniref:3'-5' exonuclease domain-containing protein n=1 Tax=Ktedonospora formicarum TaxID=2778364 RepID=A0A8J3MRG3_9CHLR|nr:HEAT repeat domain-containing protein [Ktedonospora formicarum]GHO43603.1 hypothetical protein KSX_17660 [Ktedonospora formicarum]